MRRSHGDFLPLLDGCAPPQGRCKLRRSGTRPRSKGKMAGRGFEGWRRRQPLQTVAL